MKFILACLLLTVGVQVHARFSQDQYSSRRYIIANGKGWGAFEYVDATGYHRGFTRDLAAAVCSAAGIQCDIQYNPYNECIVNGDESDIYRHHEVGPALQMEAVDACITWVKTTERLHFADFGTPFAKNHPSQLFVKKGASFSLTEAKTKKIAFMNGWATNRNCLANGLSFDISAMSADGTLDNWSTYYKDSATMLAAIKSGEIDAGFNSLVDFQSSVDDGSIEVVDFGGDIGIDFNCCLQGVSILTKPGSPLIADWNRGFEVIRANGTYDTICANANSEAGHGLRGQVPCLDVI